MRHWRNRLTAAAVLAAGAASWAFARSQPLLTPEQLEQLSSAVEEGKKSRGGGPLHAGLPTSIAARLPEDEGFVPFAGMTDAADLPLGDDWELTPERDLGQAFEEEAFAFLPSGKKIRRSKDAQGREVWDYPEGTRLMHRILLKSVPEPILFEIRYMQKRGDGKWAMGLYKPADGVHRPLGQAGALELNTASDSEVSFEADLGAGHTKIKVKRLKPDSCRHCHWAMGHGDYQYPDEEHAGPCGFVPPNPAAAAFARDWAGRYGEDPFEDAPMLSARRARP